MSPLFCKKVNKQKNKRCVRTNQQNKRVRLHVHIGESVDPVLSVCHNTFMYYFKNEWEGFIRFSNARNIWNHEAEWFSRVWKPDETWCTRFLKFSTSPTKKISLTHHLNKFSQFKYYISDVKCAWSSKKMCMILSSNCCSLTIVEYSSDNNNLNFGLARDQAVHLETAGNLYTSRPVKKPLK